jgi:hypothetical protein
VANANCHLGCNRGKRWHGGANDLAYYSED